MIRDLNFDPIALVCEFHEAFACKDDLALWQTLITEELKEVIEAIAMDKGTVETLGNVLKETCDLVYVIAGTAVTCQNLGMDNYVLPEPISQIIEHVLEATGDVFDHETIIEAFHRVHESNMSKLGEDGKPIYREDGKVLKGKDYKPCDLSDLVRPIVELREQVRCAQERGNEIA